MFRHRLQKLAVVAILTVSCHSLDSTSLPSGDANVVIAAPDKVYAPGGNIMLTVENTGSTDVTLGGCADGLEKLVGVQWRAVSSFDATCDLYLALLPAGASTRATLILPTDIGTGFYRARFTRIRINSRENPLSVGDRFSSAFRVDRNLLYSPD